MLNGILCADKSDTDSPKKQSKPPAKPPVAASDDDSPERLKTKVIESLSKKRKDSDRNRDRDEAWVFLLLQLNNISLTMQKKS